MDYFVLLTLQEEADVSLNEPTPATRPVWKETKEDGVTTINDGYKQDIDNRSNVVVLISRKR